MRLIVFLAAIAVLFSLSDASAQTALAASVSAATLSDSQNPTARAVGLRMLSWPGKATITTPARAKPQAAVPASHRIWNPETVAAAAPMVAAPRPRTPILQQATQQTTALPASIYAPPPRAAAAQPAPAPAPVIQQARVERPGMTQGRSSSDGDYQPPHFYSLYREYGQTPDPIPLNPQFFAAATPDLAQPPPPVPHTVTTSSGRVLQAVSPSPDDTPG